MIGQIDLAGRSSFICKFKTARFVLSRLALLCIFLYSLGPARPPAKANHATPTPSPPRLWPLSYRKICGPFSVAVLLRFFERPVPFADVCNHVGFIPSRGTSLRAMQKCLEHFGLHTLFVKTDAPACFRFGVPLILCLRNPQGGDAPYNFIALIPSHHQKDTYLKVAGNTAKPVTVSDLSASPWWVGQVLLVSEQPFNHKWSLGAVVTYSGFGIATALLCVGAGIHCRVLWRRAKPPCRD